MWFSMINGKLGTILVRFGDRVPITEIKLDFASSLSSLFYI